MPQTQEKFENKSSKVLAKITNFPGFKRNKMQEGGGSETAEVMETGYLVSLQFWLMCLRVFPANFLSVSYFFFLGLPSSLMITRKLCGHQKSIGS